MRSKKLRQLPPYLFAEIDRLKESYIRSGSSVLDLATGDPDLGAPPELLSSLLTALKHPEHHRYPSGRGLPKLLNSIRTWAKDFHGVSLESEEVLVTLGSKDGIAHLPLAVVDPGDTVLVPDPGYPVYKSSVILAGARSVGLELKESNGYWPDFSSIERGVLRRSKLLFLNYPNNPTSSIADRDHFKEVIDFCRRHEIVLVNDAAYSEITYERPAAVLFPLAVDSGIPYIEFFSFSKTFAITGWRIGFAIGSPPVISALADVKANLDSGVFGAIQEAIAVSMDNWYKEITNRMRSVYIERRDILARSLRRSGLSFSIPEATFYFWIKSPDGRGSVDFCSFLLEEMGIIATPGVGFGENGEGYFRLSVTTDMETIREAGRRLETL